MSGKPCVSCTFVLFCTFYFWKKCILSTFGYFLKFVGKFFCAILWGPLLFFDFDYFRKLAEKYKKGRKINTGFPVSFEVGAHCSALRVNHLYQEPKTHDGGHDNCNVLVHTFTINSHPVILETYPIIVQLRTNMAHNSISAVTSSSNYQSIFDNAIITYKRKTNKDLHSHPLLAQLETCHSPDAILTLLRGQILDSDHSRGAHDRLAKWLNPTVNVLYGFSGAIGAGVGMVRSKSKGLMLPRSELNCVVQVYPPVGIIFAGISVLFSVSFNFFAVGRR